VGTTKKSTGEISPDKANTVAGGEGVRKGEGNEVSSIRKGGVEYTYFKGYPPVGGGRDSGG